MFINSDTYCPACDCQTYRLEKIMLTLSVILVFSLLLAKWESTFPNTIEGKVVLVMYTHAQPFPYTEITFTSLGDSSYFIDLSGTARLNLTVGSTYSITYNTPFWYLWAVPMNVMLVDGTKVGQPTSG